MTGQAFVIIADVPVGYTVPSFPSLFWPIDNERYDVSYLYYRHDIWLFTVIWTLIFFLLFYGAAGLWAAFVHRQVKGKFWIIVIYASVGALQGFISGSVVGLIIAAIYNAGAFAMSTWIPMCAGVFQILFNVVTSYSLMASIL